MPSASPASRCHSQVHLYEEEDAEFKEVLKALFKETTFSSQCKGGVNFRYAKEYMRPRAEVVAWIPRRRCTERSGCSCGFGLGFAKTEVFDGEEIDIFYIDLVCSQTRMGGKVLSALEEYAMENEYQIVALRAAVPKLVKYYLRKGYTKQANACVPPSRASRLILRGLNRFAAGVGGARQRRCVHGWGACCLVGGRRMEKGRIDPAKRVNKATTRMEVRGRVSRLVDEQVFVGTMDSRGDDGHTKHAHII